jgi:hypothetical protein
VMESSIFFSPNTPLDRRVEVCTRLNIVTEALSDRYLGPPLLVGAERSDSFQYLVENHCMEFSHVSAYWQTDIYPQRLSAQYARYSVKI